MKGISRLLSAWALSLLAAIGFGALAWLVGKERIHSFDSSIIRIVQGWESPGLTRFMKAFSWIGSTKPAMVIALIVIVFLFVVLRHRRELLFFIVVTGGAPLLNSALKHTFERDRPNLHRLIEEAGYSFPSGHSMASFAMYGALTYLIWVHLPNAAARATWFIIGAALILCIGISRIYVGVHYPSDIVGGYLASGTLLLACIALFKRYLRR